MENRKVNITETFAVDNQDYSYQISAYNPDHLETFISVLENSIKNHSHTYSELIRQVEIWIPSIFFKFNDQNCIDEYYNMTTEIEGIENAPNELKRDANIPKHGRRFEGTINSFFYEHQLLFYWYRKREKLYANWIKRERLI